MRDSSGLLRRRVHPADGRTIWEFMAEETALGEPLDAWPLRVLRDKNLGRMVIADRDLAAGELVFEEEPFVQTIHDRCESTNCHHCYAPVTKEGTTRRAISCPECQGQVTYCSEACARGGLEQHSAECGVLGALASSGNTGLLRGLRGLRLFIRLVHKAANDPATFAQKIERMTEHYDEATAQRRQWLETMADQINRFVPPEVRMERVRLAKLVDRVHTNLYAVQNQAGLQFGSALYPDAGSLFNHSCAPTAVVSFRGRMWRLHTLRKVSRGEEITVSYIELYASRDERQAAVLAKKGFTCACTRCATPLPTDAVLDGWRCPNGARCRGQGAVAPSASGCTQCGVAHALDSRERAARERPWRESIGACNNKLMRFDSATATEAAARSAAKAMQDILAETDGLLCEHHVIRHTARKLRVYALSSLPTTTKASEMVEALEGAIGGMAVHLPTSHPELAFFRHRLAQVLASLPGRAKQAAMAATSAADALEVAYGADHPTAGEWRATANKMSRK